MELLIKHLEATPSIQVVYFNENGEWLFHPRAGYEAKTRDEILAPKPKEKASTNKETTK